MTPAMQGICGWLAVDPAAAESSALAAMRAALPPPGHSPPELTIVEVSRAAVAAPSVATQDGWIAAVDGNPRWLDPALARLAVESGHAAALLRGHRERRERVVEITAGAFAWALLCPETGQALLATDRFGITPLAYGGRDTALLAFASSAESVARHPGVGRRIDPQALFDYAYFHMVPSPGSIFRGVRKLERAELLRHEGRSRRTEIYWMPRFDRSNESVDTLSRELRAHLRTAVQRNRTENCGAFLSGGLDSSTVSGFLATESPHAKTFSIGFDEPGYDEMAYARITARHFGTDAHEYYVAADDIVEALPLIAAAYDEPFGNSSAVPTLFCARAAHAAGVPHLLAGDGGDEIFGGNDRYAKQKVFDRYWRVPGALRRGLVEPLLTTTPLGAAGWLGRKARSYVEQARVPMPMRLQTYNFLEHQGHAHVFTPEMLGEIDTGNPRRHFESCYASCPSEDMLDRMLYLDWKITLADNDLRKVNRMCALGSMRVSYPMLDEDLVSFSTVIPSRLKLRGTELRHFYKFALQGFLPPEILNKTKHGFGLPFGQWLKRSPQLQDLVTHSLEGLKPRGIVRREFLDDLLAAHRTGQANFYGTFVWVLVMLEQWLAQHAPSYTLGE